MEFNDLTAPFTHTQKVNSFLYLQNFILEKMKIDEPFFIGRLSGNECNLCGKVLTKTKLDDNLLCCLDSPENPKHNIESISLLNFFGMTKNPPSPKPRYFV